MEAYLYESVKDGRVRCHLCHHRCMIDRGERGICGVRENQDGRLVSLVYGKLIARNIDPIEKKPLFHLYPGSLSYSIATVGCNMRCRFCQNADISQMPRDQKVILGDYYTPEEIVASAEAGNCKTIAYTYTEPTIFFEFCYDTARIAHDRDILNVFVTNGYMTPEALKMIAPYLDAANVDLKAFNKEFYKEQCGARLDNVLQSLKVMKSLNILIEITTLLIPGLNDGEDELKQLARFIVESLGPDTPWHISRFHPDYKLLDRPPTPLKSIQKARDIGLEAGLHYVYVGNVPGDVGENTVCYRCGNTLSQRWGFQVSHNQVRDGKCPKCGTPIYGIGL